MKKKILLISSWFDEITERRQEIMSESIYLKGFQIFHAFASRNPYGIVDVNDFYININSNLEKFSPEVILLHTGASFKKYTNEILEALLKIKIDHPEVKFGVERGIVDDEILDNIGLFDNLQEVKQIEELFFKVAYGLI